MTSVARSQTTAQGLAQTRCASPSTCALTSQTPWYQPNSTGSAVPTLTQDLLPHFVQPLAPTIGAPMPMARTSATSQPAMMALTQNDGGGNTLVNMNLSSDLDTLVGSDAGGTFGTSITISLSASDT